MKKSILILFLAFICSNGHSEQRFEDQNLKNALESGYVFCEFEA